MAANIAMIVFAVVFWVGGIAGYRWAEPLARSILEHAKIAFPDTYQKRGVYTPKRFRLIAVCWMGFGTLCLGILIWRLCNGYGF